MSTVARRWAPSHETARRSSAPSLLLRIQRRKEEAAVLMRRTFPPRTKVPCISSQEMSLLRHDGGAIGKVAGLMEASPDRALELAEYLHAVARDIALVNDECLIAVLCAEQRADSEEDVAQGDVLGEQSPENLRRYIQTVDRAIAHAQRARDAAARRLRELEDKQ